MDRDFAVGVQSVVFQDYSLAGLVDELGETGIRHLELWDRHLSADDDEKTIADALTAIDDAGIDVSGYGVVDIDDVGQARPHVAFADRLGADYVTVNYPPDRDDVTEALIDLAEEYKIDVGIHNYSSVHHDDLSQVFSSIADVRGVLDRYDHPRLGVCVDTGHFLVEDVAPDDVIRDLGERINSVHLKDTSAAEIEDLPGAGRLDLPHLVGLLDDHADVDAPLVIEYELPEDRVMEALETAEKNVRKAIAGDD
ncbi:Sugar phosphate isomerase/epimerase [Halomicrobium zhouii]|uniref:Sugar phosphate isomerase/epimerase n=1 Tax=Halomicrobium zhouii TaxID=767519 RepID=A0A1I6KQI3_9EURY|nr:sugar phosphate isomerase/epimerase [Halomicrobium zhouii]SFR93476.1 Sugar phosphate isomerase/epimerase [Halomicrobium zhouii]